MTEEQECGRYRVEFTWQDDHGVSHCMWLTECLDYTITHGGTALTFSDEVQDFKNKVCASFTVRGIPVKEVTGDVVKQAVKNKPYYRQGQRW